MYEIKKPSHLGAQFRHIILDQLDDAISELTIVPSSDRKIHEARKRFKETRAVLRLFQTMADSHFVATNCALRDAGRAISALRDQEARSETLKLLEPSLASVLSTHQQNRLQAMLSVPLACTEEKKAIKHTLALIVPLRDELHEWKCSHGSWCDVAAGLKKNYRKNRRLLKNLDSDSNDENWHEWRKTVKNHWYHTKLLIRLWPGEMKARRDELKTLSNWLGDDHDLAMLTLWCHCNNTAIDEEILSVLLPTIHALHQNLRRQSLSLGTRLFAEKTHLYLKRMQSYWEIWEMEQHNAPG